MLALALTAGPASAAPGDPIQQATGSTGAAQVGPVSVDVPVRVASDGTDDAAPQPAVAVDQSSNDQAGGAQAGTVQADVPVRALSA